VQAFDPTVAVPPGDEAADLVPDDLRDLALRSDPYEAVAGAAAVVVLTEWDEFRWLDYARVLSVMERPSIVDARNLLDPAAVRRLGFTYDGIGRQ
jgi:UDPglucose 6-dehydrogenase